MIINKKYKFGFVHIPKTGGTSLTLLLAPYLNSKLATSGKGWQHAFHKNSMHSKYIKVPKNYWSFCFVRNPWDWLVSVYVSNCNIIGNTKLSFGDFIKTTTTTQSSWITTKDNKIAVDYVARHENYQNEIEYICKKLGVKCKKIPHRLNRKNRRGQKLSYEDWYDDELKSIVSSSFKCDIDNFGYEF